MSHVIRIKMMSEHTESYIRCFIKLNHLESLIDDYEEKNKEELKRMCEDLGEELNEPSFKIILSDLFEHDITWARIVSMISFSSILVKKYNTDDIFVWVSNFINEYLIGWIVEHGGWVR